MRLLFSGKYVCSQNANCIHNYHYRTVMDALIRLLRFKRGSSASSVLSEIAAISDIGGELSAGCSMRPKFHLVAAMKHITDLVDRKLAVRLRPKQKKPLTSTKI